MDGEREKRGKKRQIEGVNNSDTEAPLSGVDGVIFNKAYASEPKASGRC